MTLDELHRAITVIKDVIERHDEEEVSLLDVEALEILLEGLILHYNARESEEE